MRAQLTTFFVEPWDTLEPDLRPLLQGHWKELAFHHNEVPLDPDWDKYRALDKAGALHCISARLEGLLIGYYLWFVHGHIHYKSTLHAIEDVYYLLPEYRRGFTGYRLMKFACESLKDKGVRKLIAFSKLHMDNSRLFERLGFTPTAMLFTRLL